MKALVIEATALHLGYLGCYGNDWVETPNLDQLASVSVVFDQHYADTLDAPTPSAWSGRLALPAADLDVGVACAPDLLSPALAERKIAVHRIGASEPYGVAPAEGLERLGDCAADARQLLKKLKKPDDWLLWLTLPSLAPPWQVEEEALERYFAEEPVAEGEEPPTPWLEPPWDLLDSRNDTARLRLQNTYAGVVSEADQEIGRLLEAVGDDVLIVFTAARGLALGEHGVVGECRPWLHDELIHLPLLMRLPDSAEAGRRGHALTQPVDLLPTLLAAFGAPLPVGLHGFNLLPLARGDADEVRPYACTGLRQGERVEYALRTPELSLILPMRQAIDDAPRPLQLYVKPDDRWEVNDVRARQGETAEALEQTLRQAVAAFQQPGGLVLPPLPE